MASPCHLPLLVTEVLAQHTLRRSALLLLTPVTVGRSLSLPGPEKRQNHVAAPQGMAILEVKELVPAPGEEQEPSALRQCGGTAASGPVL